MKKTVLLYNFNKDEEKIARSKLLPLRFNIRTVSEDEYNIPVGVLSGYDDADVSSSNGEKTEFGKLVVMCGVIGNDVDMILAALRKAGFGRNVLKAVMTPTNRSWSGAELYTEIYKEHLAMTKQL